MTRRPLVPHELMDHPFHLHEALRFGVTKHHLVSSAWVRLGGGFYAHRDIANQPGVRLSAIAKRMPATAAFSGLTAAWLHGLDTHSCEQIEMTVPTPSTTTRVTGVVIRRRPLAHSEVVVRSGLRTTSCLRTVLDIARSAPLTQAVVIADRALNRRLISKAELESWADGHTGSRGVSRVRRVIDLSDAGSESVMETRLRLVIVLSGLPRPQTQVTLRDDNGSFLGRADLYYPTHRLCIEYDGAGHRETLAADNRRQNRLVDEGYRLLRFTAGDVLETPLAVVTLVRRALT